MRYRQLCLYYATLSRLMSTVYSDQSIIDSFSLACATYDAHCTIQTQTFDHLLSLVPENMYPRILDMGCGTGRFTCQLHDRYAGLCIGIDASSGMIDQARASEGLSFECARIESYRNPAPFDLIISNAAFQWVSDLAALKASIQALSAPGGSVVFSAFLPSMFQELGGCIRSVFDQPDFLLSSASFACMADYDGLFSNDFLLQSMTQSSFSLTFDSVMDLLRHIRYTGTRGHGHNLFFTPQKIKAMTSFFEKNFGRIFLSYDVVYVVLRNASKG